MRYVAFDLGDKRTGVATGDSQTRLAGPAGLIETPVALRAGEALLDQLITAVETHIGPAAGKVPLGEIVFGLPLNMDGSEGSRSRIVREFAARLALRTPRRIHFHDERLSSADADWAMSRTGLTHQQKKERRDALAAAAILRGFLESLGPEPAAIRSTREAGTDIS